MSISRSLSASLDDLFRRKLKFITLTKASPIIGPIIWSFVKTGPIICSYT